ncbi:histidinol dehydrogenase [Pseudaminobacter sp. 19-2017]|uniref:Histidinol dehydrogenase n=1 Tax=Pseudaminobacter soli (ex Zhang et al. 2022) TaxID=2831468 RepID=A0A942EBQ1_9HYPH|nr:histidinol dehydrogenase [Pseudaminobacter soli]MBS3652182.1 histidinol dehydrogenase [Pseudaminobacter soli]
MTKFLKKAAPKFRQASNGVEDTVRKMLADIAENRDDAVRRYAATLDKWERPDFRVSKDAFREASSRLPESFKEDFDFAYRMVTEFAKRQRDSMSEFESEIEPGIVLGQKLIPVTSAGCYIPGGKYPLISAAIMSIATARVAGVENVIACAPPRDKDGMFAPQIYALHKAGADEVFVLGGVQALGAMAYGCLGMPAVDIITGPGNAFVAEAKRQLFGQVGIDLLAGPTEIMVIADETADPALVATDLLGQAEHGPDSPAWLITTSEEIGAAVIREVERQLETLPTAAVASLAWRDHGEVAVVADFDEAIALSDVYAPEHLEVMTADNAYFLKKLRNYGSLFVGEESTVAYGDKGVGTNHTLPTAGAARYTGGLWVGKFIKTVTYQRLSAEASGRIAPIMGRLCHMEGMLAHEITADVRLKRYAA